MIQCGLLIGEIRYNVSRWFYLVGQFSRRWQVGSEGTYEPVDDFAFGAGVAISF